MRLRGLALLVLSLGLGACAATGPAETIPGETAAAVAAFGQTCGRLERDAVMEGGRRFGFQPLRVEALPAEMAERLRRDNGEVLARPGQRVSLLFWSPVPHCEMLLPGLPPDQLEREFAAYVDALARSQRVTVASASEAQLAQINERGPLRFRRLYLVTPRVMTDGPPTLMSLSVATEPDGTPRPALANRATQPGAATPAAVTPQIPKDPPR